MCGTIIGVTENFHQQTLHEIYDALIFRCIPEVNGSMGASVSSILKLLYREFAFLLIVAFVIGAPSAWLMTSNWLQGYSFRILLR